jgi:hypothetical protein
MDLQESMIIKKGYNYTVTCPTTFTWDYINVFDKYLHWPLVNVTNIIIYNNNINVSVKILNK